MIDGNRNKQQSVAASMIEVRRLWETAVAKDAAEGASIKSSAFLPGDGAGATVSPVAAVSAPRRNVTTGEPGEGPGDFVLGELIGKGGMGLVLRAEQVGLDRDVAFKAIAPDRAADAEARRKFHAEAQVTGQLEHPNIVPIYELASASDGALFYTMKEVRGQPWSKAMAALSEAENIDILLKVSDAVAFAHGKGVVHRDLKPENVMLGDYGEVLLMDWGLAVGTKDGVKAERLSRNNARGGTPAYMAPEMAAADPDRIGPASDVYLLGAILHEILTGLCPHHGQDVFGCLASAHLNTIQPSDRRDEWMAVARKALATGPGDRPADVKAFQRELRDCREHAASLAMSKEARETLARAKRSEDYTDHARAVFGFGESLRLWPENHLADMGLTLARKAYAETALRRGDFDLALSQTKYMSPGDAGDLGARAETGKAERERRRIRVKRLAWLSAGLAGMVLVVGGIAYWRVSRAEKAAKAEAARATAALDAETRALASEQAARRTAEAARKEAVEARTKAETALTAKEIAESKERAARDEQVRLSGELAEAAEKLGLWEKSDAARAALLRVPGGTPDVGGQSPLAMAANELAPWPDPTGLEKKAKVLTALSLMASREEEYASAISAFEGLVEQADRQGNKELAGRLRSLVSLLRVRLPEDHALAKARAPVKAESTESEDTTGTAAEKIKNLHAALKAANPQYDHSAKITANKNQITEIAFSYGNGRAIENLEPLRGLPLRKLQLRGSSITDLSPLAAMPLVHLDIGSSWKLNGAIQPLRGLPLEWVSLEQCGVKNLDPLRGKTLGYLGLYNSPGIDTTALADIKVEDLSLNTRKIKVDWETVDAKVLKKLSIRGCDIDDLAPLKKFQLTGLNISANSVSDLSPLRGMPLTSLDCAENNITSLDALRNMPLKYLSCFGNRIKDLEPLKGMKLQHLSIEANDIEDYGPLKNVEVETLCFVPGAKDVGLDKLRGNKSITSIYLAHPGRNVSQHWSRDEFWSEFDRGGITQFGEMHRALIHANPNLRRGGLSPKFRDGKMIGLRLGSYRQLLDLSPLAKHPFEELYLSGRGNKDVVIDLSLLKSMPLKRLELPGGVCTKSLQPLADLPITYLMVRYSKELGSLEPLRGVPLKTLILYHCNVSDIGPLAGKTFETLELEGNNIADVRPLLDCRIGNLKIMGNKIPDVSILAKAEHIRMIDGNPPSDAKALAAVQASQRLQ